MNVLWSVFEVLINVFQGFAFCFYVYKYLNSGGIKDFFNTKGVYYSLSLAGFITFFNNVSFVFEHLWALIYVIILFAYAKHKLNGNMMEKLFASVIPLLLMIVSSALASNFAALLFKMPLETILTQASIERFITIIITQLTGLYTFVMSLKILKKDKSKNTLTFREWFLIISVFIISIVISALLNFISIDYSIKNKNLLIVLAFVGIIVINFIVIFIVIDLSKMNNLKYENELLKIKEEYTRQYISDSNTEHDVIRKMRHDFKDNWGVVYKLISENKNEKALSFLEEFVDQLHQTETIINTKNEIVNAVVNVKLSAAKSYGINVICMCVTEFEGISDFDLCSLLSNLLENALSACKKSDKDGKRIYMNISADDYGYNFCIKNTIHHSVLTSNPKLISTKKNAEEHGIGLKIINGIVDKYNGNFDFYEENDEFCCNITLKKDT